MKRFLFTVMIMVGAAFAGSPALSAQTIANSTESRLTAIEQRLAVMEKKLGIQTTGQDPDVAARLETLDQEIRIVNRQRELEQDAATTKAADTPVITANQNGFSIQSPNGDNRLVLGMVTQMDAHVPFGSPKPVLNTFTIRKLRPTFSGRVFKFFDFKVMPDFGNGTTVIQDAYFDARFSSRFRIRTGKDKTPIGYELLQSDAYLLFPERSLASGLVPNRDIGIQAQGDLWNGKLFYSAGVINGILDGASTTTELDTNNGKDLAGRTVIQPFKSSQTPASALSGLGFQIGGSYGKQSGGLPSFKTSVGQTYFSYASTSTASGVRRRISPAWFYYYKSFGAFGEYMQTTQGVARAGVQTDVTNRAWEVTGSWVLTGEAASDRGVKPKNNFDPTKGKWGALQLVSRFTELTVDRDAFTAGLAAANASRQARSYTVGFNWYPNAFIKYYANFERTNFYGGAFHAIENVVLIRAQLAF